MRRALLLLPLLAACGPPRSTLNPAGPAARTLAHVGWPILIGFSAVSLIVWGLLAWLALRRTGSFTEHAPLAHRDLGMRWIVIAGFVLPGLTFATMYVATLRTMDLIPHAHRGGPTAIRVTGHQWWWDVEYVDGPTSQWVHDANEIHIPAGRPVEIELRSVDVIHSFWVPRLHGKVDLVPGMSNHITIEASQPGAYSGACAEYCGVQHAHMRFMVIAETPAEHQAFLDHLRADSAPPSSDAALRGQAIFMSGPCAACHTVRGTPAAGRVGPELTHFGARGTIAAGAYVKDLATEHAWVANAPSLKPGTRMPAMTRFGGAELADLVAYLESLR